MATISYTKSRMSAFPALLVGGLIAVAFSNGCATQARRGGSASLVAEADWPPRITVGLERLAADVPDVLLSEREEESGTPIRVVRCVAYGLGIVLELDSDKPDESVGSTRETELVFISFSPLTRAGERLDRRRTRLPKRITFDDPRAGVPWHLYEPKDGSARGLIVHLGGNKYVGRALLKRGWAVLSASSTGRFLQRRQDPITFEIERGEHLIETAGQIALVFDDELADWPYSLEAVLQYLAEHRTDIPQTPTAVMGFSIGAIALPAVAARMPDRFQAAVLVAGGANLLEIARRTHKPDIGIKLEWVGDEPRPEDWRQLYAAYLEQVRLDPYHTVAALTEMPVLMYHAAYDQVVPGAMGELLFARMGDVERLVFPVGHKHLLRVVMRLQAERIVEWTETALSEPPRTSEPIPAK